MLKRAIAMSLEQEEEEEGPSSIKGEQKIQQQKRWIVTNVHKLSTFSADTEEEMPPTGDGEAKVGRKSSAPSDQVKK